MKNGKDFGVKTKARRILMKIKWTKQTKNDSNKRILWIELNLDLAL